MLKSRAILFALAAFLVLAVGVYTAVMANGNGAETETTGTTTDTTKESTVTAPTGAGPAEAALSVTMAPITAIQSRGHVDNMCESAQMMGQLVRQNGTIRNFGDYNVAYMLDAPKGSYQNIEGRTTWVPPAPGETQHIEVVVLDSLTNKPIPMSPITLDVVDSAGNVVQSQQLAYYWHPMADHYGANYSIPTAGTYSLRIKAPAPNIRRHDRNLGDRFTSPLDATFTNVRISPRSPAATDMAPTGAGPTTTTGKDTTEEEDKY